MMNASQAELWEDKLEEECLVELLRRDQMFSPFRPDRLRLPVAVSESLEDGDKIQCFHDTRSGFADWARVAQRGRSWTVQLISWKERPDQKTPPPIHTLGALLDYYQELRINTTTQRRKSQDHPLQSMSEDNKVDNSWLAQCNEACYVELGRRCRESSGFRLRFRIPRKIDKPPSPGDILQMFHDRLTGFSTYGSLHFDTSLQSHFVRIFQDGPFSSSTFVEVPLGAVLDQHAEIRIHTAGGTEVN